MESQDASLEVPLPVSTQQTEADFVFQKFNKNEVDRTSYLGPYADEQDLNIKISNYYSLDELTDYLLKNPQFGKITFQFPDSLVMDSGIVSRLLEGLLAESDPDNKRRLWVLADSAYSSCCVDEVAAEHVSADLVVHFGDACLNAIQKLPVVYSFGKTYLELNKVADKFRETFADNNAKVCLMASAPYSHHVNQLYQLLAGEGYENLIYSTINTNLINDNVTILGTHSENSDNMVSILGNRMLFTSDDSFNKEDFEDQLLNDFSLFYISVPQDPHLLYLSTIFNSVYIYDNAEDSMASGPFPSLMKRYRYMHVARTAGCIGILVNTLSLRNTKETINKLTKLIKNNGKKHYLFVVGKPNVAKLANFEPVDIWCILGCGQSGIIVDQFNEFYKPIITPYELTMALNQEVTWTGKWVVDFENALKDVEEELVNEEEQTDEPPTDESEVPEFDAVTGKLLDSSRPLRNIKHLELESPSSGETSLIHKVSGGAVIKGTVSTSVAHLESRHWAGLGTDFNEDEAFEEEGASVEQGTTGVARGYGFDRHDAVSKEQH